MSQYNNLSDFQYAKVKILVIHLHCGLFGEREINPKHDITMCWREHKINIIKIQYRKNECVNIWNYKCDNESDAVRLNVQVRELCGWREKYDCTFLDNVERKTIIDVYVLIEF